jgi:UDP-N-acetyl-2-amino-2-deoxyglucuronate dehydrogenase
MKDEYLKVGVIGCGRVFDHYLKIFKKNQVPFMKIIACCDKDKKKLELKTRSLNIRRYLKIEEMLKKEKLDLFLVLTPSGLHYKHCKFALNKSINVLCEKPMSLKVKECKELIKISNKNRIFYGIVYQNRLNNAIQFLRRQVLKNKLGKIIFCNVRLIWSRDNSYYSDDWHGTWKMDGGVLNQQLIHHLDVMINAISKVSEINSFSSTLINKLECEDTISASFKLKNGALGQIIGTTGYRPHDNEASIELITDKGIFKIGGIALNKISKWIIKGKENKNNYQKYSEKFTHAYGNGHEKMLNSISKKLLFNQDVDNFSWCKKRALETSIVVSKIYKSIEVKKNVYLNDNKFSAKLGY